MAWFGFLIAGCYMYKELVKIQYIKRGHVLLAIFLGALVQEIGGSLLGYLYKWIYFHEMPSISTFNLAGRYFHSVFLSMLIYILLLCKWLRWPAKKVLDIYAVATLMMSSIGRIGCYFQGCCIGKSAPPPWGVSFPEHPGEFLIPTQLYMMGTEMFLCLLLMQINKEKKYDGQVFCLAVLFYSIYRFIIEFFRTNPIFILGLSHAQVFSLLTLITTWILLSRHKAQKI